MDSVEWKRPFFLLKDQIGNSLFLWQQRQIFPSEAVITRKIKESVTVSKPSADASLEIQYWIWDYFYYYVFGNNKNLQELPLCICLLACGTRSSVCTLDPLASRAARWQGFSSLVRLSPVCVPPAVSHEAERGSRGSLIMTRHVGRVGRRRRILAAAGFILTSVPRERHTSWNSLNYTPSEGAKVKMATSSVWQVVKFWEVFFFFTMLQKKKKSAHGEKRLRRIFFVCVWFYSLIWL